MDIKTARNEREQGNLEKALELFLTIDKTVLNESELFDYYGELGLTYLQLKNLSLAISCFQLCQSLAFQQDSDSLYSVSLRHLSNPIFHEKNLEHALSLALEAREMAKNANRNDLVWFDQGVINCLSFSNSSKSEISKWLSIMVKDLYEKGIEEKDDIALWVWVTGYLIELSKISENKDILYLALLISEKYSLKRKIAEINKINFK
jgi:tetratricopeptide (TPR) repeat protein